MRASLRHIALAVAGLLLLSGAADARRAPRRSMRVASRAALGAIRFQRKQPSKGVATAEQEEAPAPGDTDVREVADREMVISERPELPPLEKAFVIAHVDVEGLALDAVYANSRSFKAALASVLPEEDGVTGNDIAIERIAHLIHVAGHNGETADVPPLKAEAEAAELEEEEATSAEDEDSAKAAHQAELGARARRPVRASLLEVAQRTRTPVLPDHIRVRFRLTVPEDHASAALEHVKHATEGEGNALTEALRSEALNVQAQAAREPQLITRYDEAARLRAEGFDEDEDEAARQPAKGGSSKTLAYSSYPGSPGMPPVSGALASPTPAALPSFAVLVAIVLGLLML